MLRSIPVVDLPFAPLRYLSLLALVLFPFFASAERPGTIPTPNSIEPFFETYCYNCHDADTAKADLNLEDLTRSIADSADALKQTAPITQTHLLLC